ncbi:MAG: NAD(P)-dependent oxidoreductase [Sedimentisphaerales bacterium]|nr:NAD(P)-dependent oxidoreductase [Sedimentisphaerales bacterium]
MNILVVGGAGYIGGAITDILQKTDHKTRVYDSLVYEESYRKPVDFICDDVRNMHSLRKQLDWADAVIWLAALVGDGACAINPGLSEEINQYSVQRLADNYNGRIIFTSTCSVYGAQGGILTEESPTDPLSVYAKTKLEAEQYLSEKNALIFRLGTLFGVSDLFARLRLDLVVNIMTVRAAMEGELTVFGGEQFRPLLHVKDVAEAIVEYVDSDFTGIYNLHRQNVRIIDLAYQVRNHFPDTLIKQTEMKFQDSRNYRVGSEKVITELGWKPKYSIDDGIIEIKELIQTRRLKDVSNPRYTNQAYLTRFNTEIMDTKVTRIKREVLVHAR